MRVCVGEEHLGPAGVHNGVNIRVGLLVSQWAPPYPPL